MTRPANIATTPAAAIASHGGFVADRSPLDFFAFWLIHGFGHHAEPTEALWAELRAHLDSYDRIVILPFGVFPLKADGVRSTNPWVQRQFQATLEGLASRELTAPRLGHMPPITDKEERVRWVLDLVAESGAYARESEPREG
jgi:hypothetical protein